MSKNRCFNWIWVLLLGGVNLAVADIPDEPTPNFIRVEQTDMGPVYADKNGMTLYSWSGDNQPGKSLCTDEHYKEVKDPGQVSLILPDYKTRPTCEEIWPPALVDSAISIGSWVTITRANGNIQLAYGDKPLYTSVYDLEAGQFTKGGPSFFTPRKPLQPKPNLPTGVAINNHLLGRILTTQEGWTLYTHEADDDKNSRCAEDCLNLWAPLNAPAVASNKGVWSILNRPDGLRQWMYQGKPLYRFKKSTKRYDADGAQLPGWRVAVIQPKPEPPTGITRQMTSGGEVYADSNGKTLYGFYCIEAAPDSLDCAMPLGSSIYRLGICSGPEKCMETWPPVIAPENVKSDNHVWSIVYADPETGLRHKDLARTDGLRVYAYHGKPVYTFSQDKEKGDFFGDNIRVFPLTGFTALRTGNNDFQ